ncbi:MAG: hypothetical protein JXQ96_10700 [Cyclobacteriaceae bacterium]
MARDFDYLLKKHGKEGARQIFEDVCAKVFKMEYENAHQVQCNPGDEGIDVFVGNFAKKIKVFQCKCFFYPLEETQKSQIKNSFKKAIGSKEYEMEEWHLCIPKIMTIEDLKWWSKWKKDKEKSHKIKIGLMDSTELLLLIRKHNLHLDIFDEEELKKLDHIIEELDKRKKCLKEILEIPDDIDFSERLFSLKLQSAAIDENSEVFDRQFFNAELLLNEIQSKGIGRELKEYNSLKTYIHEIWLTQYLKYDDDNNGNMLLGNVFSEIEASELGGQLSTSLEISTIEKKGVLHQLADECKIGWVKNYQSRLKNFIKEKENSNE